MIFILCEDEGAGLQIYRNICEQLLEDKSYELISSYGNRGLEKEFKKLKNKIQANDKILLAFDNVDLTSEFDPNQFLFNVKKFCNKNNVELFYTKHYCFEEIYLSSSRLIDLCCKTNKLKQWHNILKYIYENIMEGNSYYDLDNSLVQETIKLSPSAIKNREQFCKAVLHSVTLKLIGHHQIDNRMIGNCWIKSCEDIEMKDKEYRCLLCLDYCKDSISLEKVKDICINSVLKENEELIGFLLIQKFK